MSNCNCCNDNKVVKCECHDHTCTCTKESPVKKEEKSCCESGHCNTDDPEPEGCGCGCSHNNLEGNALKIHIIRLIISFILIIILMLLSEKEILIGYLKYISYALVLLLAGYDVYFNAIKNILKGKLFDENFLMTIASVGAFVIGEVFEGIIVIILYGVGEILQQKVVAKSRGQIKELMNLKPDVAYIKKDNNIIEISLDDIKINDILVVKPGEKIGLDGIVVNGSSYLDTSNLTGESIPRSVNVNDEVLSGSINTNGLLEIKVTTLFKDSTISKILEMVENAASKKAVSEKFITKFSKVYTPIVVIIAFLIATIPPLFNLGEFSEYIYKALSFLLISCPCALVISIPVTFYGGLGCAAKQGILIKGGNYLESLYNLNTIVFDKTGTLTKGIFEVSKVISKDDNIIRYAAIAESNSNHPIAKSIISYYNKDITDNIISYEEIAGMGVVVESDLGIIHAGNIKLMNSININNLDVYDETSVYISLNNTYIGCILISDQLKETTLNAINDLKEINVNNLVMLTGDKEEVAKSISNSLGLSSYKSNLLPHNKVEEFENIYSLKKDKEVYAFVGDGINDSPVLTRADVGIAMGGIGSDAAIEAADVVIMNDDLTKIVTAKKIANKTRKVVTQNIVFSLGTKLLIMFISLFFTLPIVFAIIGDVGVSIIAILNARRSMKIK